MTGGVPARGSLRSRGAAAISGYTLRPITSVIPPERAWGLWLSRQIIARIMGTFGPSLAGTRVEPVDTRLPDGRRVKGEWVYGPRTPTSDTERSSTTAGAIYYVHGSGYAVCSPKTHRRLTSWLSSLTGLPVFCIDYRLAPKHRFPTAADDVRAGWDWLVDTCGLQPKHIVIAGDSAGGHLSVDLLLQPGVEHPAAMVLFSPLYDLSFELALARERIRPDPATSAANAVRLVGLYHSGVDLTHQRLTLDVAGGPALPPTLIQAGGAEMLQEDARQLAADIRTAGGRCELQIWPHQVHVFQALPRMTPEAAKAMAYVARFIAHAVQDARAVTEGAR
ncbi:alpha/beta hydrolase [Mycobacterium intracellulare]|uniref:Alpha/beta hydrolase n=1 Tax=Mycobacterium intracellulare subsp. chimaera TaxID=222805 RepID=A0A220YA68_MYCIT|nr:alpha/beta hydrolase [Mycobacterium intracellulare]ASL08746.1 lipK [Mycobacterium intracellulare subsp. chimaera]ASL14376.1 lipK [Mycobacterium intracellulare subsp. chimaera]ASL20505.1 lipK [Mycobacterium intracellulare subsp. chimaera]MCA2309876.1 alpha/beta hydrolase [Mycobacterium intracellulare subsp. chimaera]MCA2349512.1 alpha/beta hydrolase [Mycobacterium intracellulare subsp. chimaera]